MKIGTDTISAVKVGSTDVVKMNFGSVEVFGIDPGYDIIGWGGQSNSYAGEPHLEGAVEDVQPHVTLDATDPDVYELDRTGSGVAILAEDQLANYGGGAHSDWVGPCLAFAKWYKANGYLATGRKILIVHGGDGGTGFGNNSWNKGDTQYEDFKTRLLHAKTLGGDVNRIKMLMMNLGESDSGNGRHVTFKASAITFIDDIRSDLSEPDLPIVFGGMVNSWVILDANRMSVQADMTDLPNQRDYVGFASSVSPTILAGYDDSVPRNHFSGRTQRGHTDNQDFTVDTVPAMAWRFGIGYKAALINN